MPAALEVLAALPIAELLRDPAVLPWLADALPGRVSDLAVGLEHLASAADLRLGNYLVHAAFAGYFDQVLEHGIPFVQRLQTDTRSLLVKASLSDACGALGVALAQRCNHEEAAIQYRHDGHYSAEVGNFYQLAYAVAWELNTVVLPFDTLNLTRRDTIATEIDSILRQTWADNYRPLMLSGIFVLELRLPELTGVVEQLRSSLGLARYACDIVTMLSTIGETALLERLMDLYLPAGTESPPGRTFYLMAIALQIAQMQAALDRDDLPTMSVWLDAHDRWLDWAGDLASRSGAARMRAEYQRAVGDVEQAHHLAQAALQLAADPRQPVEELATTRLLGELDTTAGDYASAADRLEHAMMLAVACRAPFETALTQLAQAELAFATGQQDDARSLLAAARTMCEPVGAKSALERIARLDLQLA